MAGSRLFMSSHFGCLYGSVLIFGAVHLDTPFLCRPSTGTLPSGLSFGVWPFSAWQPCGPPCLCRPAAGSQPSWCVFRGLAFLGRPFGPPFSLPLPPVCWFATFAVRLSGSGLSWGALRPSLLALHLSRGLLLLFPRLSGFSFCLNYGWLYLGGLIITGPKNT